MCFQANLPRFLPGTLILTPGRARDYRTLQCFHYAAGPPATWAGVWVVRYLEAAQARTVAVGVLSWPVPSCRARERWFGLSGSRNDNLRFANENLRTISRVVVHPQFRSLGLSRLLVQCLCHHCPTRYVESIAVMGHVHPLFERAGMTLVNSRRLDEPAYFVLDRQPGVASSGVIR